MTSLAEQDLAKLDQALRGEASREDCDELHRAVTSLRMVLRFLGDHASRDASGPLRRLHAAVSDVEAGGSPSLFERERKAGRPSGLFEYDLRGLLAGALDLLVQMGMNPREGANWLWNDLRKAGLSRDEIRPDQIVSWRMKANAFEGPQPAIDQLRKLRARHNDVSSLPEAQRIAGLIADLVAMHWETSKTPILGES